MCPALFIIALFNRLTVTRMEHIEIEERYLKLLVIVAIYVCYALHNSIILQAEGHQNVTPRNRRDLFETTTLSQREYTCPALHNIIHQKELPL